MEKLPSSSIKTLFSGSAAAAAVTIDNKEDDAATTKSSDARVDESFILCFCLRYEPLEISLVLL